MLKQAARKATSLRFWRAGIRLADASSSKGFEAVRKVCSEEAFNVTHLDCFAKRIFFDGGGADIALLALCLVNLGEHRGSSSRQSRWAPPGAAGRMSVSSNIAKSSSR